MDEDHYQQIAKTFHGLEETLAEELHELGAKEIQILKRAVSYEGDNEMLYKANLHLRTALAILVPIESFLASDADELYKKAMQIEWDNFFSWKDTFSISHSISSEYFEHSQFAALKLKDAIVDYFRKTSGKRPNVDRENPNFRINLRISGAEVTLSFDSSGEALFKRGYRQRASQATLNEILAAGMILMSGWKGERTFIDPMCGGGTLPIEATMIALNIPAGFHRHEYGFMNWPDFDRELWNRIREEARAGIKKKLEYPIIGTDILAENIEKAEKNAQVLRCNQLKFGVKDFFEFERPDDQPALIMMNPPYGERLQSDQPLDTFYKHIGDELKQRFAGCEAWVISSNMDALKSLGLHASRKVTLFNGPLECRYLRFDLYEGSKKLNKNA